MRHQKPRRKKKQRLNDLSSDLRGPAQSRFGGHQSLNFKTYGGKFGAASECVSLSWEEVAKWAEAHGFALR